MTEPAALGNFRRCRFSLLDGDAGNLVRDGTKFTRFLHALQAADTIGLIGPLIKPHTHGAPLVAFLAQDAFVWMINHPEDADLVEEGIDRAQGTDDPAEGSAYEDHQHQKHYQEAILLR